MAGYFNEKSGISGNVPFGSFNAMFNFTGSWQVDAAAIKSLSMVGNFIPLYVVKLAKLNLVLLEEIRHDVPYTWDPPLLASFIENYGTHIVISITIGGRDVVYIRQHQSSPLSVMDIENYVEDIGDERFMDLKSQSSAAPLKYKDKMQKCLERGESGNAFAALDRHSQFRDSGNGQKAPITTLFEQVGLHKILSLLESEDANVRIHAVNVVANLAAEEVNQEKIVEAGGLSSLLMLLRSFEDETVHRVAAGAIANLAMNEANQELIMVQGGISLLAETAADAEDPQTLRMVAGAIANLCGNDKLQTKLRSEGGIRALLGMVRCGHPDVLSQVARGIANFAKCESRACTQGVKSGRSLLIEDGALPWIVQNANDEAAPIRRHIELALCHLSQHEVNAKEMISGGALWELVRISRDCSREDIRSLASRTLSSSPTFRAEMRRLRIEF